MVEVIGRRHKRISVGFAVYSAILSAAFGVYIVVHREAVSHSPLNPWVTLVAAVSFTVQATVLTYRRPENRIGWLLMIVTLLQQVSFGRTIAEVALVGGARPTSWLHFWFNLWAMLSAVTYSLLAYIFVLFPDGRLLSRRWRPVLWTLLGMAVAMAGMVAYLSFDFARVAGTGRPVSLEVLEGVFLPDAIWHPRQLPGLVSFSNGLIAPLLVIPIAALASQTIRFRRGATLERQQIKWVIYAMVLWVAFSVPFFFLPQARGILDFVFAPIVTSAIAVPILRYRLYDIDFIIRRTLSFALLSALLALTYFGVVSVMQWAVVSAVGRDSPAVIVVATLASAALFSPLRRRVQAFIDLRFYRRRYVAERVLSRFAESAQRELELEQLTAELLVLVDRTLRPESVTLWLKE